MLQRTLWMASCCTHTRGCARPPLVVLLPAARSASSSNASTPPSHRNPALQQRGPGLRKPATLAVVFSTSRMHRPCLRTSMQSQQTGRVVTRCET